MRRFKTRYTCLAADDERDLCNALLEAFPDIKYLHQEPYETRHQFLSPGEGKPNKQRMAYVE